MYRVAGRVAGAAVLLGDIAKGFVPALAGQLVDGRPLGLACGVAAMVGHIAPVTRGFRGGKGVATFGGACWALYPLVTVGLIAAWLITLRLFRKASLGSIVMAVLLPIGVVLRGRSWWEVLVIGLAAGVIILRHRSNIARLFGRAEHAISE